MPKLFKELEILCNADKRKSTNELPFVSAHMLHDLYLRWTAKHDNLLQVEVQQNNADFTSSFMKGVKFYEVILSLRG